MGCLYRITVGHLGYIGITTKSAVERLAVHAYEARRGTKGRLYNAMRKHGVDAVQVETLVIAGDWDYLCDLERRAIRAFGARSPLGLNMTDGGDGASPGSAHHAGFRHSEEARAKMAAAKRGKPRSDATRAKIAIALRGNLHNLGRTASAETRAKQSLAQTGKTRSPEQRANIAAASRAREALKRTNRSA